MSYLLYNGKRVTNNNQYVTQIEDPNKLSSWANSSTNPYSTFDYTDRSNFRIVKTSGSVNRVYCNEEEVKGYAFDPGPPPKWGSSVISMDITWNSGTPSVYLQLYYGTSQQSSTVRNFGEGNTISSGDIIVPTQSNVRYAVALIDNGDITISNATWTITDGVP